MARDPDKPLDLATMTPDEIFEVLNLEDMDAAERLDFLRWMSAYSRTYLPGPNMWWIVAVRRAAVWRAAMTAAADQLIESALPKEH